MQSKVAQQKAGYSAGYEIICIMPPPKRGKMTKKEDKSGTAVIEGISSVHSWIKAQTMVRPSNLGRAGSHDSDDDEDYKNTDDTTMMDNLLAVEKFFELFPEQAEKDFYLTVKKVLWILFFYAEGNWNLQKK